MPEVSIGLGDNGDYIAVYQGQNLFTRLVPNVFTQGIVHVLSQQIWQSVVVQTNLGVVIFEMQDNNWIFRTTAYPPTREVNTWGDGIITNYIPFGEGLVPRVFLAEIEAIKRRNGSIAVVVESHIDEVTVFLNDLRSVLYQGSDGRYYDTTGTSPFNTFEADQIVKRILVEESWFYYQVELERGPVIAAFDRFGDLEKAVGVLMTMETTTISGHERIMIPLSLQAWNDRIPMQPVIENPVANDRLDNGEGSSWYQYMSNYSSYHLYFVDGYLIPYLRNNEGFVPDTIGDAVYIRVSDRANLDYGQVPNGVVRYIPFSIPEDSEDTEVILYIADGVATVFTTYPMTQIINQGEVALVLPPSLQHETRLWKLLGPNNGPLMRLFNSPGFDPSSYQSYTLVNGEFRLVGRPRNVNEIIPRAVHGLFPPQGVRPGGPMIGQGVAPIGASTFDLQQVQSMASQFTPASPEHDLFPSQGVQSVRIPQRNQSRSPQPVDRSFGSPSSSFNPPPLQRARPLDQVSVVTQGGTMQFTGRLNRFPSAQESIPEPTIRQIDIFNRQSLERFLSWYYPSPLAPMVEPDNLEGYTRTPLDEIASLLNSGQVTRFESPPVMQPWAGSPGTTNRIFTFQTIDGRKLFTKAQYNQQTNQLLPPQ